VHVVGGVAADSKTTRGIREAGDDAVEIGFAANGHTAERLEAVALRSREAAESPGRERPARLERLQRPSGATEPLPPSSAYERLGKPVLDRVGGTILAAVLLPIVAIVAVVIRLTLGSPVFYVQERVGQHGRRFHMYKFRTMQPDRRREQRPFRGVDRRVRHKTAEDPRHTRLGKFLRRRSLDELPQLWNVVRGDMSLVGPRPELPSVVAEYGRWQHRRHLCKPGVTGLWQVSARNNGDGSLMHEHTNVDLEYLRGVSLRTDLAILCKTLGVLGGGE
jgi:lipopolysaccharide/colanic/teichoic acid biosynthesis glycosyltransferase